MTADQMVAIIKSVNPIDIIRLFSIGILILHLGFSIVVVRQTKLMIKVIEGKMSPYVDFISVLHLLFSIFTLVWALIVL
ncbi:hypothetical protein A2Y99_00255 [Candidatus Gottesmanbacteria bacterium RBG_13_37_7]|uniref:Uncharacterized protein n=1 Tax=Candidatus Gottesmanbacteria bacterium RBG_13_37_7 TaxID=1798369 RepID=A0A1F5YHV0_9BACT|nr:MAG: hypothetical protein A2Y99_00255 [Candidatus Gottesmanbacteria bacterium RBG_13_37_7]